MPCECIKNSRTGDWRLACECVCATQHAFCQNRFRFSSLFFVSIYNKIICFEEIIEPAFCHLGLFCRNAKEKVAMHHSRRTHVNEFRLLFIYFLSICSCSSHLLLDDARRRRSSRRSLRLMAINELRHSVGTTVWHLIVWQKSTE